jgi:hypothetical protein
MLVAPALAERVEKDTKGEGLRTVKEREKGRERV